MLGVVHRAFFLQKTKIPARGLKPTDDALLTDLLMRASKNQNPREGIETDAFGG